MSYPKLVEELIQHLTRLPGVGRRSAERMVFWFLDRGKEHSESISSSIMRLRDELRLCRQCNNLSEADECLVCRDARRDRSTLCVVEDHKHLMAIEKTGAYNGLYHVLMGAISPADGRGPEDLRVKDLIRRVLENGVKEVVIATDPDTEGEMTALHLANELKPLGVKISRIGFGIPVGGSVEYADISTLTLSMSSRREMG